ncbi:hypothetical protein BDR26DRAFT_863691 [Obelidium mucronatum]|nr:hypothetical protein BDR26DRAFT_863691 [Obelidium mucronatum]
MQSARLTCRLIDPIPWTNILSIESFRKQLNATAKPSANPYTFPGLSNAIQHESFKETFFISLLPQIVKWASNAPFALKPSSNGTVEISSRHVEDDEAAPSVDAETARFVLSNMFLLNTPMSSPNAAVGSLDLTRLFSNSQSVAIARILCLLSYFQSAQYLESNGSLSRKIEFERRRVGKTLPAVDWENIPQQTLFADVSLLPSSMESSNARFFVDFANKYIHIHEIIGSATQEEVLFSCCPEAFLGIAFCPVLADDEVIVIRNVKRFVEYTGYGKSFAFVGPVDEHVVLDLLVMDAVCMNHFAVSSVLRDMNKAALAFSAAALATSGSVEGEAVVTGHWGCGMFGGNKTHKFIQQWLAASVSNVKRLDYALFGDQELAEFWDKVMNAVKAKSWTVSETYIKLLKEGTKEDWKRDGSYEAFVARILGIKHLEQEETPDEIVDQSLQCRLI